MHIGTGETSSATEAMYFPPPKRLYSDADTPRLDVIDNLGNSVGFIYFTTEFKYLGSIVHYPLTSDVDCDKHKVGIGRLFWDLKNILINKHVDLIA
jgi:hypothetical protein